MPTIRDGRGVRTEHDMTPPPVASPPAIERRQVSAARMADFAAERAASTSIRRDTAMLEASRQRGNTESASRARGAAAAGFVKGNTAPKGAPAAARDPNRYPLPRDKAERNAAVLEAIRTTASVRLAGELLRVSETRVGQIIAELRAADALPEDVATLIQMRRGVARGPRKQHVQVEAPGIVPRNGSGNISPPDPTPAPEPAGPPPVAAARPDVVLPCEGCVHAAVCAIKPVLVAWADKLGAPVPPHEAIGVGAISISCAHELQAAS